ncbi:MAG: hypothetical protein IPJ65_30415 [Archangiaceae bacterium]|nr:hypothetical protein [Archangiaceae bacterium]
MTRRLLALSLAAAACSPSAAPEGLMETPFGSGAEVKFDVTHRPLPDIPLPNDFASRFDPGSPTKLRVNASQQAATAWETGAREVIDQLDGWGTFAEVSVGFTRPLDVLNVVRRHQGDDYDFSDDAVFLVDVSPESPGFCKPVPLNMGEGNFPLVLESPDFGMPTDPRFRNQQLIFDETDEDLNRNGKLDPGEDTDVDGVLDRGNYAHDRQTDGELNVMTFYERETNTLIMKPVVPMHESTVYAAVITRRLTDEEGKPVRSPFAYVNHAQQTRALQPLRECLPGLGLAMEDVAFTWSFTTQSTTRDFVAVRDGLYGVGPMQRLSAKYPGAVSELFTLRKCKVPVSGEGQCPSGQELDPGQSPYILKGDDLLRLGADVIPVFFGGQLDASSQGIIDSYQWVDFTAVGQIDSPQFFRRTAGATGSYGDLGDDGQPLPPLPLYQQVFQLDPVTGAAFDRPEKVTFWLTVPKGRHGKPAPVVLLGHGYTSAKLEALAYAGYFARLGLATLAIDAVSHGIDASSTDVQLAAEVFRSKGLDGFFRALANDRAVDLDGDGRKDSGADFWTSYVLHTRDVVKQSTIDHLQLVRVLKGFDGVSKWKYDVNRNGERDDLAGDFDGDGVVDVGGPASVHMTGGSLGGIVTSMMGGLEPYLETALPVSGGGGLADVGIRSIQGGVKEAVNWRMFGPMLSTRRNPTTRALELVEQLPSLNGSANVHVADLDFEPRDGDTVVVRNGRSNEYRCSRVHSDPGVGTALIGVAVSSDQGDPLTLELYDGVLPSKTPEGCDPAGMTPRKVIDTLGLDVRYQSKTYAAGSRLIAFGDGFGLRRNSPELRRFMALSQVALESGDPVNMAPLYEKWLLKYGTGEEVRTRAMVIASIGDMNVPVATGVQLARAAGFVELNARDPRYGKTANRVLIDHHVLEGVERVGPYRNSQGAPVLIDVDHYSAVASLDDGFDVPRLDPPLRLQQQSETLGGWRGLMLPMANPTGQHGFDPPNPAARWNLGGFMFGAMGRYMRSDGREFNLDACNVDFSCADFPSTVPGP